jgi:hypothetical protein
MVYHFASACISSLDRGKSMRNIMLFKDENISKSTIYQTIKDCENVLPCVVKPKIAKPHVADDKKMERRHGLWPGKTKSYTLQFCKLKKNDVIHKKQVIITKPT